jgi:glutaredoxin
MYVVYGKPNCAFCEQAKMLLTAKGQDFTYVDVSQDVEAMSRLQEIGARTVPQIFFDGELIGGFTHLRNKLVQ